MEGDTENADDADESSVSSNNAINKYFDCYCFSLLLKHYLC